MIRPRLTFWGVRGSIPTPGPATARYGGNTPCVAITSDEGRLIVLDAGTGIRPLGDALMRERTGPLEVDLLLSHTHWDHIQGLPFFKPLSDRHTVVRIHGAPQDATPLGAILERQMDPAVFPVPLTALAARVEVHEIGEGAFGLGEFRVTAIRLRHPGNTLGYRLDLGHGGGVAYLTDNELGMAAHYPLPGDWRARLVEQLRGVDTLIHDAMYADDFVESRVGWGHSSPTQCATLAQEAGVRRLVLFHHEPEREDAALDALLAKARAGVRGGKLVVDAAREGESFEIGSG